MNFEALPVDEFLEEATELLQEIEDSLLLLEEDLVDQNIIQRLFRSAHTLKGGAAMVGLSDLANHAHEFEAILSQLRSGTLTSTPEIVSVLLKGKDNLSSILNPIIGNSTSISSLSINENQPTDQLKDIQSPQESRTSDLNSNNPQIQKNVYLLHLHFDQSFLKQGQEPLLLIRQLEELGETTVIVHTSQIPPWTKFDPQKLYLWWSIKLVTEKTAEEIDELLEFYRGKESDLSIEKVETPVEEAKEVQDAHQNMLQQISEGESVDPLTLAESTKAEDEGPEEAVEIPKVSHTIRVPVSRLDRLQNLVSETVIHQARLLSLNEAIQATDDELGEQFLQFVEDNEQAVRELQDQIQQVRMVPVGTIFSPMKRVVREFATRHQKQIKLEIYGAETELDKTITEQIQGPLMHLLRNAMDHGLEAPEQRRESGKNPIGTITLQASHQAGFVVVEVKDDGRGLDPDKILAAGRRLGIVAEEYHLSEQEALQLIFQPGFTTTKEVTDVSGRGVGMDAVKKDIEALLGNIEISSQLGHGTTMKLKLPLSLAIIEGMLVRVGVEMFVLPLLLVTETLRPLPKQLKRFKNRGELIDIRGQYLPLVRLHQHLNIENAIEQPEEGLIIVVQQGSQNYCLLVDNIEDQLPVVIKSLEEHFVHIPGIAGATILGDGSVCFIIDVAAMLN
ncbi:MAG: chemotaxis protein CheA [SAR324 cluster bacterium]|nr:chemotaxis protein CheA [SAR324 cluster bacterium]